MIEYLNPSSLPANPAFTQVVTVRGGNKLVFVGNQNAVASGDIVSDDLGTQAEQAFRNMLAALDAAGATLRDVVRLAVRVVEGHDITQAFAAARNVWGTNPPMIGVSVVSGLANSRFLIEVEAIAALREEMR
ncbi:RidA family protein [Nonomuraea sp. NPDC003707]